MEIAFTLAKPQRVEIVLYDLRGRRVTTLLQERRPAGPNSVVWEGIDSQGRQVASGNYFARIEAGSFMAEKRLTLIR